MQADNPEQEDKASADLNAIREAKQRGPLATLRVFMKLSGPGWLQSAITLGGGSLAASLYLGVLAGVSMLWLQPLAMVMGIVMLSAIAYVALSTGERPFGAINKHINPVLGWSWAIATLMANMVWALPQFSLATGVAQQNLAPGLLGKEDSTLGDMGGKIVIVAAILAATIFVTWSYGKGSRGVRIYERMLKIVVAAIVACFVGVVVRLGFSEEGLAWGDIFAGFIPDLGSFNRSAEAFGASLDAVSGASRTYWTETIVGMQRDVMISAAATAVGINMTFLLPYTLLARGWGKEFRGLARFDLATGMLIPFLLATSCVVIASASRFHAQTVPGLVAEDSEASDEARDALKKNYHELLQGALKEQIGKKAFEDLVGKTKEEKAANVKSVVARLEQMTVEERRVAAMLVKRDAFDLAQSLRPLTGDVFANILFGLGVLGMALSTITVLMLISGFVICEMLGIPPEGKALRYGALAATTGALGPFFWKEASFYLAVPTSVFGMMLLPIAYWTFFIMMNSKRLLGDSMPRGNSRIVWNVLMLTAAGLATVASVWSVWNKAEVVGISFMGGLLALAVIEHFVRKPRM